MNYRFSNKQEYFTYDTQPYRPQPQPNSFQRPQPQCPYVKSPLHKFESEFDNFHHNRKNENPKYCQKNYLSNNPYISQNMKLINYSSSSSESGEPHEPEYHHKKEQEPQNSNILNNFDNLPTFNNNFIENNYPSNDSQSIPSIHVSDDSKKPKIDIFQKAFIVGLEKLKGKNGNWELSPISPKNEEEKLEEVKVLKLEPILPIIKKGSFGKDEKFESKKIEKVEKNVKFEKNSETSEKSESYDFEAKRFELHQKKINEMLKNNSELEKKEEKIQIVRKKQKTFDEIFDEDSEQSENKYETKQIQQKQEKPEKLEKPKDFSKKQVNKLNLDFLEKNEKTYKNDNFSPFDLKLNQKEENYEKPSIPLIKTNKNIFNTPTCTKYAKKEDSSHKKPGIFDEKQKKDGSSHKKPTIWDENQPKIKNMKNSSQFNSNEKQKAEIFGKIAENSIFESGEKKKSGFYCQKLEVYRKSPEISGFVRQKPEVKEKENEHPPKNNNLGFLVADRINLIDKKRNHANNSFDSDFTLDSNVISKGLIYKSPYVPTKGSLISPLQKI